MKIFVLASVFAVFNQAQATRVDSLYDVQILVEDETAETREQAFNQGLDEIFIRLSGDGIIMDKLERPPASRYVKQFSYEPVPEEIRLEQEEIRREQEDGGEEVQYHWLKIHYNGSSMEKYLLSKGFSTWGQYRPDMTVWLVVRDGRNEYVLKDSDKSQIKKAAGEALNRRGVPVRWPLYDDRDRELVNTADIRGGFLVPVVKASRRYSRGPVLSGSMAWNGSQWQSSWALLVEGENHHWRRDDTGHRQLLDGAINQAADLLGAVYAVDNNANKQQREIIYLDVQQVNSIEDYSFVESYLNALNAVTNVRTYEIEGNSAVFELILRSSRDDFLHLINSDGELVETEPPDEELPVLIDQSPAKFDVIPGAAETTAKVEVEEADSAAKQPVQGNNDQYLPFSQLPANNGQTDVSPTSRLSSGSRLPMLYYRINR